MTAAHKITLTDEQADALSLVLIHALASIGEQMRAAQALGVDVRGFDEARERLLVIHRIVLGGEA